MFFKNFNQNDTLEILSNIESQSFTIDSFIEKHHISQVDLIKMDIEGAERRALAGCEQLFRDCKKIDFAICTYHLHDDEEVISAFLDKHNCTYRNQKGFFRHKIRSVVLRGNKKVN